MYNRKLEKKDKINNVVYFLIIFLIQLVVITYNKGLVTYVPSLCNNFSENVFMPYIIGILGIAFWLRVSDILKEITKKSKIINTIADNTYGIMIHQFLGFFIIKTIFAILSKINIIQDFDWLKYKSDIWYYYIPNNLNQWFILYLIAGIVIPILINKILDKIEKRLKNKWNKVKGEQKCQHT